MFVANDWLSARCVTVVQKSKTIYVLITNLAITLAHYMLEPVRGTQEVGLVTKQLACFNTQQVRLRVWAEVRNRIGFVKFPIRE